MRTALIFGCFILNLFSCSRTQDPVSELPQGVYYILDPECPLSKRYSKYINEMDYRELPVNLVFTERNKKAVDTFISSYISIEHTLIRDKKKRWVKGLGGKTYPESFLVVEDSKIAYHGLINNWYSSITRRRKGPSKYYLQDAIENYNNGRPIDPVYIEPIGCYIEL